jgi:FkbM family methyltransferase
LTDSTRKAADAVKRLTKRFGLYRAARWLNRHLRDRQELRQERDDRRLYAAFIRRGDLVFDIGANVGSKTRVFVQLGARVIACEPQPDCLDELRARVSPHAPVTALPVAVAAGRGSAPLYVRPERGHSGMVESWTEVRYETILTVETTTLDALIATYGMPALIKIDVEGFEAEVLKGLTQSVPVMSLEYSLKPGYIAKTLWCVEYLAALGDVAINVTPAERATFRYPGWLTPAQFQQVFPDEFRNEYEYRYGDLWIRFSGFV